METETGEALNDKEIYLKSDRGTQLIHSRYLKSDRGKQLVNPGKNMVSGPRVRQTRKEQRHQYRLDSRKIFSAVHN